MPCDVSARALLAYTFVIVLPLTENSDIESFELLISLSYEYKFFGMSDIQQNAFTIKTLNDAINLRNHIIYLLEQCDQLLLLLLLLLLLSS